GSPAAMNRLPITRRPANPSGSSLIRQRESHHGTATATIPGAKTKKIAGPMMDCARLILADCLPSIGAALLFGRSSVDASFADLGRHCHGKREFGCALSTTVQRASNISFRTSNFVLFDFLLSCSDSIQ